MSLIAGYLNQVGQVKRSGAAVFFDGPAAATLEIEDIEVGEAFKVKVRKSDGEAVAGTVTVYGKNASTGNPDSEVLTYSYATQTKTGYKYFSELTAIETSMAGEDPLPNIRAVAVDGGGAEITVTTWEDFACRWEQKSVSYWTDLGNLTLSDAKVMTEAEIEAGDWIRLYPDDSIAGHEVKSVKPATGLAGAEEFRTLLL